VNIKVEPILLEQKSTFIQLFNLYSYDFTEYTDCDIDEHGYFNNDYANNVWTDEKLHHFFIRVDGKLAGFVIVGNGGYMYLEDKNAHNIYEFFVVKKYRRNGVGSFVAKAAFDMFKGKWEVCQMQNNIPARKFWKSVICEYTKNNYQECGTENDDIDNMVGFIFDNSSTK
jgi:predicted acetyltransferase